MPVSRADWVGSSVKRVMDESIVIESVSIGRSAFSAAAYSPSFI
jgi:hypothetical protein